MARVIWDTNVAGRVRVPRRGPIVLVANHIGVLDGPLLLGVFPRPVHFLVKEEMFSGPIGWLLKKAGQISVDRSGGRAALAAGLGVLKRGGVVGVFPEGVRGTGTVAAARAGAAWLAVQGNATVIPVAILGTRRTGESVGHVPRVRRRFAMIIGHPIAMPAAVGTSKREAVALASVAVQNGLARHVARAVEATGYQLPQDEPVRKPPQPRED
ncbi:MAG TPA: lysophospholipid acyltransferase family protein [Actinomycetales bacterium]|nr:lysophospholipid acyltransferase family protein [Actinomycetales bacterium]